MKKLKINKELKKLIPPLTDSEYKLLEESIINEGCRDKLITWDDTIIDGHNRYGICTKHGIPFQTEDRDFQNIDTVKVWMIDNQKGRRNLTDGWKWELAQSKKKILEERGRENLKHGGLNKKGLSIVDKGLESHNTQQEIAKDLGWSTGKVAMADVVWNKAKPEVKEKIKTGETSINRVYQDIKKDEKQKKLQQKKDEIIKHEHSSVKAKPSITELDAITFLNGFKNNSIDLLITDPPYMTDVDDIDLFTADWLTLAIDKIKPNGRAYICSGAYPNEVFAFLNVLLKQSKFIVDNPLVWTYRNTLGVTPKMKYNLNYQLIWHMYSHETPELDTSITNEMFSVQDINAPDGRLGNRHHKWQKPNELARRLITHGSKEGDIVVDPFAGSGTFLIEAGKLNRTAFGCDIDKNAISLCVDRGCKNV